MSNPLLLERDTVVVLLAAWFSVTVQVLEALLPRVEGEQASAESCAGAVALSMNVWEPPLRLPVSRAV